eukprot:TRINITY_DN941_c0_g1_i2.p2 TRINITY_DN941_c0_g1~~TRINITY_DN941_c0_g1_i2.p2  ORF type:complete len:111 (+),score=7.30 TRINITY_DN941_c0_g1_i2:481-813(+)
MRISSREFGHSLTIEDISRSDSIYKSSIISRAHSTPVELLSSTSAVKSKNQHAITRKKASKKRRYRKNKYRDQEIQETDSTTTTTTTTTYEFERPSSEQISEKEKKSPNQ